MLMMNLERNFKIIYFHYFSIGYTADDCIYFFSFYQIRTALKVSPKLPVKVEVNLPRVAGDFKSKSAVQSINILYPPEV